MGSADTRSTKSTLTHWQKIKKMPEKFLHGRTLEEFGRREIQNTEIPSYLTDNLSSAFEFRLYQKEAFARFLLCFENNFLGEGEPLVTPTRYIVAS